VRERPTEPRGKAKAARKGVAFGVAIGEKKSRVEAAPRGASKGSTKAKKGKLKEKKKAIRFSSQPPRAWSLPVLSGLFKHPGTRRRSCACQCARERTAKRSPEPTTGGYKVLPFFFFRLLLPTAGLDDERKSIFLLSLTWSIVAAPTTATILPALARASRTGAWRAAALVEALLRGSER